MNTYSEQKSLASFIDRCASRANMIGHTPATSKQCWFLAGLIIKCKDDEASSDFTVNTSNALTKKQASLMISNYLA